VTRARTSSPQRRPRLNRRRPATLIARLPSPRRAGRWLAASARRSLPGLIGLALIGALALGAVLGHRWLTSSPRFALAVIELEGNRTLDRAHVLARLGAAPGDNLFELDLGAVRTALEREPWISSARVRRRLPDRLVVEIEEHRAAALVALGDMYLADEAGRVFKRAAPERGEGEGLPIVTGITRSEYQRDPAGSAARIRDGLALARAWAAAPDRPRLGEVHLDRRRGPTLLTYDGPIAVRVGRGPVDAVQERLRAFDTAWESLEADERSAAEVVHLDRSSAPDRVTFALAETR
jgi:cell division septal protein FtsQ